MLRKAVMRDAKRQCAEFGCTLTERDGEFRVNFAGGFERTAYYTDDLADAIGTARAMTRRAS